MAISKNRKIHAHKVAERYEDLVEMRLAAGMLRSGHMPKPKGAKKGTPYRNPKRVNMTKGQKRVAKAIRHAALTNEI